MKTYKMADLLKKDQAKLQEDLIKLKTDLVKANVKAPMRKAGDDTHEGTKLRKQIARLNTALSQLNSVKSEPKAEATKGAKE